jgi:hypothetical protein
MFFPFDRLANKLIAKPVITFSRKGMLKTSGKRHDLDLTTLPLSSADRRGPERLKPARG